tara:strand:- start:255 stop:611 length:357 start_codon:yes stop_codon:yes gene_type:complete
MSLYNPDIDGKLKIEPTPKIINNIPPSPPSSPTTNSAVHLFNPNEDTPVKPPIDLRPKRPQYLIDRDREEAIASAEDDKEETEKIMKGIQKKDDEDAFYKSPIEYEGGKLFGGIIGKL